MIHHLLQIADFFVQPTDVEGFPRVLIEAMAACLPVVTTNAGGINSLLPSEQVKFVSNVGDHGLFVELVKKMEKMSSVEREILGLNNREHARKFFSTEAVAQLYISKLGLLDDQ